MVRIILPELGDGIVDAEIVRWHCREGQSVKFDEDVVELVTDKAVFNVPADFSGRIMKIYYNEGQRVPVGSVLADLDENFSGAPEGAERGV